MAPLGKPAVAAAASAVAVAVCASLLTPDWVQRQVNRFDLEADSPLLPHSSFSTSDGSSDNVSSFSLEVPGEGVMATAVTPFLVVISPAGAARDSDFLANFLAQHTEWLGDVFFRFGGVIFRGFDIPGAQDFEKVVLSVTSDLATVYLGTSPRSSINGTTYVHTAADFPPHRTLPTHLEMSFRDNPPKTQMFYAHRVEQRRGGETPLTNFEGVWQTLKQHPRLGPKYENAKVKYIRNNDDCTHVSAIDPLVQKCWQDMFKTSDRSKVLEKCEEEQFNCTFKDDWHGRVQITNVQPFIRKHPITGKEIWFNHINVLSRNSMVYDYERTAALWGGIDGLVPLALALYYRGLFGVLKTFWEEEDFGFNVAHDDGSNMPEEDLHAFKRAVWQNTFQAPYQKHDIVIVDNMKVGHGREMFQGVEPDRVVMTAWSDNYPSAWVSRGK